MCLDLRSASLLSFQYGKQSDFTQNLQDLWFTDIDFSILSVLDQYLKCILSVQIRSNLSI